MALAQITRIDFRPCTGFGGEGRSATLGTADGKQLGIGFGATDDEAVAEALMDSGLSMGEAYDAVGDVMRNAAQVRHE